MLLIPKVSILSEQILNIKKNDLNNVAVPT